MSSTKGLRRFDGRFTPLITREQIGERARGEGGGRSEVGRGTRFADFRIGLIYVSRVNEYASARACAPVVTFKGTNRARVKTRVQGLSRVSARASASTMRPALLSLFPAPPPLNPRVEKGRCAARTHARSRGSG